MRPCECGCGNPAPIAKKTHASRGWVKGRPIRFIVGHNNRGRFGTLSSAWKGGRTTGNNGYVSLCKPRHPEAHSNGYVYEHRIVSEKALGKPLPAGVVVHHVNGNQADNRPQNLVLCQGYSYHRFLHVRLDALRACGNANRRRCQFCRKWDRLGSLIYLTGGTTMHPECRRRYRRQRYAMEKSS